jgi:hypothetical protein
VNGGFRRKIAFPVLLPPYLDAMVGTRIRSVLKHPEHP